MGSLKNYQELQSNDVKQVFRQLFDWKCPNIAAKWRGASLQTINVHEFDDFLNFEFSTPKVISFKSALTACPCHCLGRKFFVIHAPTTAILVDYPIAFVKLDYFSQSGHGTQ